MQHTTASLISRQLRSTALNASRQSSNRIATKSHVRHASSSSSSNSSASTLIPYAAGAAALGLVGYVMSSGGVSDASKRKTYAQRMIIEQKKRKEAEAAEEVKQKEQSTTASENDEQGDKTAISTATNELAEQASQESAFDPETNTINWACPCLGGMADGPCGEEFKKAFSCFVFSEQEPKGIDCVEHFKAMQDCFRKYPEHYKEELEDEEDLQIQEGAEGSESSSEGTPSAQSKERDEDEGLQEWRTEMSKESS